MEPDYEFRILVIFATLVLIVICFTGYSCQVEENKLRAKCIEARGSWTGNSSNGTCIVK